MGEDDVPSPIDFHDPAQARAWEADTIARRPWRPDFFAGFAAELNSRFAIPSPLEGGGRYEIAGGDFSPTGGAPARAILHARPGAPGEGHISILELGSGPGHLAKVILSESPQANYCALDYSEAMHALAREHLSPLAGRAQFIARDFCKPDWYDGLGPFDAVVTMQAAHELRHNATCRNCCRRYSMF